MGGASLEASLTRIGIGDRQLPLATKLPAIDACIFGDGAGRARRGDDRGIVAAISGDGDRGGRAINNR